MLRGVASVMMILFCLFWAIRALQSRYWSQFAISNSITQGNLCFRSFRMILLISLSSGFAFFCFDIFPASFTSIYFNFFILTVAFISSFAFSDSPILFTGVATADFTLIMMAVFCITALIKFRNWFGLLASATSFRYDYLRHNRFSNKRLCLEPLQDTLLRWLALL